MNERGLLGKHHPQALRKGDFTLVELLIVVAIIAILAAILLPALNSALAKAKSISCTNQLKQQGTALLLYCADNDEYLPSRSDSGWTERFFYRLIGFRVGEESARGKYLPITTLCCPEMPPKDLSGSVNWWSMNPDYGVNELLYFGLPTTNDGIFLSRRLSAVRSPSRKYMFVDTYAQTSAGIPDQTKGHWRLLNSTNYKTSTGFACFAGRHSKKFNGIHVDGSALSKEVMTPLDPYWQEDLQYSTNPSVFYWDK